MCTAGTSGLDDVGQIFFYNVLHCSDFVTFACMQYVFQVIKPIFVCYNMCCMRVVGNVCIV